MHTHVCFDVHKVVQITFNTELGDVPPMTANGAGGGAQQAFTEVVKGTKENVECSNHGYCSTFSISSQSLYI